jgi:hypothetical protein
LCGKWQTAFSTETKYGLHYIDACACVDTHISVGFINVGNIPLELEGLAENKGAVVYGSHGEEGE